MTVLCGIAVIFGLFTTLLPLFTTRSPYKTPMSNLLGNLWRSVLHRELKLKGFMEAEEMDDVDAQGETLDMQSFIWLMKNTRSEETYQSTVRAEREYRRQLHQHKFAEALSRCAEVV